MRSRRVARARDRRTSAEDRVRCLSGLVWLRTPPRSRRIDGLCLGAIGSVFPTKPMPSHNSRTLLRHPRQLGEPSPAPAPARRSGSIPGCLSSGWSAFTGAITSPFSDRRREEEAPGRGVPPQRACLHLSPSPFFFVVVAHSASRFGRRDGE